MTTTIRRFTTRFASIAACIVLAHTAPARAAIAPAENLLPADTLAFFTVPDTAALRAAGKTSPQVMFWNDDAMRPFREKFMVKFNEKLITPLENDLGMKAADFFGLPQGQFTLAVTANGSNGHDEIPPGLLLLLDAKENGGLLKTNLAALTKKWTDAGRTLRTEKIHGLAFTVVPLGSNDFAGILPKRPPVTEIGVEPKPEKFGEIYFAQYESLLVAGNVASVVDAVAAHLTGGSAPAVADDPAFASDRLSQFRDAPVDYGWFNAAKAISLMMPADGAGAGDATASALAGMTAAKILGATGLGGLKSASFAVRETPEGSSVTLHLTAPESTRAGVLKMIALAPKDAGIPAFVPADAIRFSRFRLDGRQTWADLQKMVSGISPQYLAYLNSAVDMVNTLGQAKDPAFDLRNNLFGNLGDDIIIYGKPPTGDTLADYARAPSIYLVAVSNPDLVVNSVKNLAALVSPQDAAPTPRDYLGHKIYTLVLRPTTPAGGDAPVPSYLYMGANSRYLALSQNTSILEEFLRVDEAAKPLREAPGIADAAAHVGGMGGGLFTYENQRETMRAAFKLLKNSAASDSALAVFPPAVRDWVDFTLLPGYDAVSKYFYLSVAGASANAGGLTLTIFAPRPPQLH